MNRTFLLFPHGRWCGQKGVWYWRWRWLSLDLLIVRCSRKGRSFGPVRLETCMNISHRQNNMVIRDIRSFMQCWRVWIRTALYERNGCHWRFMSSKVQGSCSILQASFSVRSMARSYPCHAHDFGGMDLLMSMMVSTGETEPLLLSLPSSFVQWVDFTATFRAPILRNILFGALGCTAMQRILTLETNEQDWHENQQPFRETILSQEWE